jgi:hypothetical protein
VFVFLYLWGKILQNFQILLPLLRVVVFRHKTVALVKRADPREQRESKKGNMLKLKSRAVLETPTTGLSRQLSKTGINESSKEDQGQLLKANTNDNNNNNNNNEASQQHGGGGLGPSQKPSIHRYQPRFAPSQQPPPLPYSQDGFDVADYCTPADQQFELVGNIAYANTKNSAGG